MNSAQNCCPFYEFAHLPLEEQAHRTLSLADTWRDAIWQATHPVQFQALLDQTLAGLQVGADELNRQIGARQQLEARMARHTYNRLANPQIPVIMGVQEPEHKQNPQSSSRTADQINRLRSHS